MNKLILNLVLVIGLTACSTGGGGHGTPESPVSPVNSAYQIWLDAGNTGTEQDFLDWLFNNSNTQNGGNQLNAAYQIWLDAGNTGTEQDFLDWLSNNFNNQNGGNQLTPAEMLFGEGNGLGATPTDLINTTDNAGFAGLSFASWGNVYNLNQTNDTEFLNKTINHHVIRNDALQGDHINFLSQIQQELETYTYYKDGSVANSTFKGPAIMYVLERGPGNVLDYDHGSMKLTFGQDIDNAVLEFVMHDPANNVTINPSFEPEFSEDRNKVDVHYKFADPGNPYNDRYYHGYGIKE